MAAPETIMEADAAVGRILAAHSTVESARDALLERFPAMTPLQKQVAAQHLVNLTDDAHSGKIVALLKLQSVPEAAIETFMNDLANRPDAIVVLKELAASSVEAVATRAKSLLDRYQKGTP